MADSPQSSKIPTIDIKVLIDGKEINNLFAIDIEVGRYVNKTPKAKVSIIDGDTSIQDFEQSNKGIFEPGKPLEIQAGSIEDGLELIFKGIIVKHRIKLKSSGKTELVLHGGDKALKLKIARKSQYFKESSDSDLIKKVLGEFAGDVADTSEEHPLIIQNNATDWDFVMSRADVNGLIAVVDDGKVNIVKPAVTESPVLTVTMGDSMIDCDLVLDAQYQIEKVTSKAWDYKTLEVIDNNSSEPDAPTQGNLDGKKLASVLGVEDYTLATTASVSADTLKTWADAQMVKSRLSRVTGTVTFQGSAKALPNSVIAFKGVGDRFNGGGYVSGVSHVIEGGFWKTEATIGLSPTWFVETYPNVSQPPAAGLLPGIQGLQNGTVKSLETDPDGQLRIFVNIPLLDTDGVGVWARLATFYASAGFGAYFIPEVNDEVILGFLNGDPNFPIILGVMYNGDQQAAPFDFDEENNQKGIVTRENLKITFDEEKKSITIETPAGNKATLDDDGELLELEDQNGNKITMNSDGITLSSSKDLKLDASSGKIVLEGGQGIELSSNQDISLEAKMNIKNKATSNFEAEGTAGSKLKSSAMVEVNGSAMVKIEGGLVKIN